VDADKCDCLPASSFYSNHTMVSSKDREILRAEIRSRNNKLDAADRENLLKPYLPDPSELSTPQQSRASTSSSQRRQKTRKTPIRTFIKSQIHRLTYAITHIIVRLLQAYHAIVDRVFAIVYHHHRTPELIRKDVRGLKRIPEHLSIILTLRSEDDALAVLMDEVAELTAWSSCAGIQQLSVYEKTGMDISTLSLELC
jgi:dehydrodolichyl diphosphate syntase complex subunit NUS1